MLASHYHPASPCITLHHPASPCISITISVFGMSPNNRDHNSRLVLYLIEQYALRTASMIDPPFLRFGWCPKWSTGSTPRVFSVNLCLIRNYICSLQPTRMNGNETGVRGRVYERRQMRITTMFQSKNNESYIQHNTAEESVLGSPSNHFATARYREPLKIPSIRDTSH